MASTGIRRSRRSPALAATVVAGIVAPIVAGCATVPSSNAPRQVLTGGNAVQAYPRPLPPPPPSSKVYTSPTDAVLGFLSASAAYAYDPGAARQFLSPALRKEWQPGPVTVVSSLSKPKTVSACLSNCTQLSVGKSPPKVQYELVKFTAQHLATLSQGGQYEYSPGTSAYPFKLAKENGIWLITSLPLGGRSLLLTKASFEEVYQPRNLFFFARPEAGVVNGELVPDPVYAPLQSANSALNTDVVTGLVKGLLSGNRGWLTGATTTAFPAGTTLHKVTLRGQVAVVNLGGSAARTDGQQKNEMNAQLQETLTSNAYSSPLVRSVVLEVNGRTTYPQTSNRIAQVEPGQLVYQSGPDTVSEIVNNRSSSLAGPEQIGSAQISVLAATTAGATVGALAVAVQSGGGCTVVVPVAGRSGNSQHYSYRGRQIPGSGGACTSLSWDRNGNLWAVAGGRIWLLASQTHYSRWLSASSPAGIVSMQMAPDGVRAALLVTTHGGKSNVLVADVVVNAQGRQVSASLGSAVPVWTGLPGRTALSWFSEYDLAVLARGGIWQVPLGGGAGRLLATAPAGAVSLASDGHQLAVGTSRHGRYAVQYSANNNGSSWTYVASNALPLYPAYSTYSTYQG